MYLCHKPQQRLPKSIGDSTPWQLGQLNRCEAVQTKDRGDDVNGFLNAGCERQTAEKLKRPKLLSRFMNEGLSAGRQLPPSTAYDALRLYHDNPVAWGDLLV